MDGLFRSRNVCVFEILPFETEGFTALNTLERYQALVDRSRSPVFSLQHISTHTPNTRGEAGGGSHPMLRYTSLLPPTHKYAKPRTATHHSFQKHDRKQVNPQTTTTQQPQTINHSSTSPASLAHVRNRNWTPPAGSTVNPACISLQPPLQRHGS